MGRACGSTLFGVAPRSSGCCFGHGHPPHTYGRDGRRRLCLSLETGFQGGPPFSVIAFWCDKADGIRFIILKGMPFGLASAVLHYNRGAEFIVAIMRCILGATCTHFYDDHLSLEPSTAGGTAQIMYRRLCKLLTVHLDMVKHKQMAERFIYVGVAFDLQCFLQSLWFSISPKEGRVEKVCDDIRAFLKRRKLRPSEAAYLLGICLYVSAQLHGRCTRMVDAVLIRRQYSTNVELDVWTEFALYWRCPLLFSP